MPEYAGTANILNQFTAYNKLCEDYSPEVANTLTQRNLARHNVQATINDVDAWHRINTAASNGLFDITAERHYAEKIANKVVIDILDTVSNHSLTEASNTNDIDDEDYYEDDVEKNEDELPSLSDIYGHENQEDNDEAALDDVLKAQERLF